MSAGGSRRDTSAPNAPEPGASQPGASPPGASQPGVSQRSASDAGDSQSDAEPGVPLTIADAQARVHAWISHFEEGYWPPLTNLARLIEEVGELAREMNHRFGHKTKKPEEPDQDLAIELADIMFVLLVIANEQGIDLEDALERVLEKYRARDSGRWTPA